MIIFVGDKPSPNMRPDAKPFEGAACEERLLKWIFNIGIGSNGYRIVNWNEGEYAAQMLEDYDKGCLFLTLGKVAKKGLYEYNIPNFNLPHPSGRNRQINNKSYIEKKLKECREWLKFQEY